MTIVPPLPRGISLFDASWRGSGLGMFKDELEDKVKKHKLGRLLGFVAVTQKLYAFRFEAGWRYYKQSGEPLCSASTSSL